MTHRLVPQARSHWPAAISSRGLHEYILSSPICPASSSKRLTLSLSRTYASHSHVGAPPEFPRSSKPKGVGPSDRASRSSYPFTVVPSSTYVPESPTSSKVASSGCISGSSNLGKMTGSSMHTVASESPKSKTKENQTPEILVFHNPTSKASLSMLSLLQQAQKAFPNTTRRTGPPLNFKLTVLERLPTVTELQDMYYFCNEGSWTVFHANRIASSFRIHPTGPRSLLEGVEYARKAEVAKAKQNPRQDNPHEAVVTQAPSTDSLASEPSTTELADMSAVPNIDHPLFGTHIFSWPVIVCWSTKDVLAGANAKQVNRLLKKLAEIRDPKVIKSKEQLQEEERKGRQASWTYPEKHASPDEEDTLKWFNESSKKPVKKVSW